MKSRTSSIEPLEDKILLRLFLLTFDTYETTFILKGFEIATTLPLLVTLIGDKVNLPVYGK